MRAEALRFGMPTLAELGGLEDNIALAARLGLSFIELTMSLYQYASPRLMELDLEGLARKQGLGFSLHLPEELDLGQFNEELREGSLRLIENLARRFGGGVLRKMNLHINKGVHISLPDRKLYVYEENGEAYTGAMLAAVDRLAPLLKSAGITLCFENTGNFGSKFAQELVEALCEREMVGVTWDFGHSAASGEVERPFLLGLGERVRHAHLHDFRGGRDHQELFTGTAPIEEALDYCRRLGIEVVIETKDRNSLENSVRKLRERYGRLG